MADIYIGLVIMFFLAVGLFLFALHIGKSESKAGFNILTCCTVGLLFFYSQFLLDSCYLSWVLPFSNLIIVGNWLPLFAAFLAGLGWQKIPGKAVRKCCFIVPLILVALHTSYGFFFHGLPIGSDFWKDGVSLQTSNSSCGASCVATLLKNYHIDTSEKEMIPLCLTKESGTLLHGLYRGLKLKTQNTRWKVEMFQWSLDELRKNSTNPVILRVGLKKNRNVDPRYHQKWGWLPGVTHIVVFFGFRENNRIEIGDPAVGREHWNLEALDILWNGQGIRLVSK